MKHAFHLSTQLLLILFFVMVGCKKEDVIVRPGNKPQPAPLSHKVHFKIDALPGTSGVVNNLFAVVSLVNDQDQPVLLNHKLALKHDGAYYSDTLTLSAGQFKITKFLIVDQQNLTQFAVPFSNSEMGGQVQKPLAIQLALPKPALTVMAIDVLKVSAGDQPQKFGYPADAFNLPQGDQPDTEIPDPNPFIKIKVLPLIKIGDVVYDSIPVAFTLTSWNAAGVPTVVNSNLPAGTNEISLPKSAVKYDLQVSKWGTLDVLSLRKQDVQEGTVYTLGGSKAAKKLQSIVNLDFEKGAFVAKSKTEYQYNGSGKLQKILLYKKRNNVVYVDATEHLTYNATGLVEKIVKQNEAGQTVSETSFTYSPAGKVVNMVQKEGSNQTTAQVSYTAQPGHTGITGNFNIDIRYQYTHQAFTRNYNLQFKGGNKAEDLLTGTNGDMEIGKVQFDFNINPYIHMGLPDLQLSNASKHNMASQQRGYDGSITPMQYVAAIQYTYDADGYPKEAVSLYMNPFLGTYMGKTKTVYYY